MAPVLFVRQHKEPAPRWDGSLQELYKEEEEGKLSGDLLEALEKQRNDLEEIAADAVIGNLKSGHQFALALLAEYPNALGVFNFDKMPSLKSDAWSTAC